jgi:hypothetical protein
MKFYFGIAALFYVFGHDLESSIYWPETTIDYLTILFLVAF